MPALKKIHETREQWLTAGIGLINEQLLKPKGYKLPKRILATCGFARGSAKAIGMCWPAESSQDGKTIHVSVCPTLEQPVRALDVLLHELGHASGKDGKGISGHGKEFRQFVRDMGLDGKPTATIATEGSELYKTLKGISQELGVYPHTAIKPRVKGRGKAGGGWVRLMSPVNEEFKVVVSPKMLEEFGVPKDPDGNDMVPANAAANDALARLAA